MHELEINGTMYQFNFGIGFVREIDQTVSVSRNGVKEDVGLQVAIAGLLDGKVTTLETVLMTANSGSRTRGGDPRHVLWSRLLARWFPHTRG